MLRRCTILASRNVYNRSVTSTNLQPALRAQTRRTLCAASASSEPTDQQIAALAQQWIAGQREASLANTLAEFDEESFVQPDAASQDSVKGK